MHEIRGTEPMGSQPDIGGETDVWLDPSDRLAEEVPDGEVYEDGVVYGSAVRKLSPTGYSYIQTTGKKRGRRDVATSLNSFGLSAGTSCPGKTPFCDGCYALNAEQMTGVAKKMHHNFAQLSQLETPDEMAELLVPMVERFVRQAERRNVPPEDMVFRKHWDGDYFNESYARGWATTMGEFPMIRRFLAFTRSFGFGEDGVDVLPYLADTPNLSLYLSLDEHNAALGQQQYDRWHERFAGDLMRAWCTKDYESARELAAKHTSTKPVVCPENSGKIPLMKDGTGACIDCGMCFDGRRDVIFSTSHREIADPQVALEIDVPATPTPGLVPVILAPTRRGQTSAAQASVLLGGTEREEDATQEPLFA